jgi:hypothetical protein
VGISQSIEQTLERAAIARNRRRVLSFSDRHLGDTIFVLGSSPQLNRLSPAQIELLSRAPAIGLNRTQYRVPAMYFLGSHNEEVGLAVRVGAASEVIHMSGGRPMLPGTLAV